MAIIHRSLLVAIGLTLCGIACGAPDAAREGSLRESSDSAVSYVVRGVVRFVSDDGLEVRHQAIPDFRDADGEVVGMDAMSMAFAIAPTVSVEDVEAGDKVEFELTVDWSAEQAARITTLRVLPPETELEF